MIALVVSDVTNPVYFPIIRGAEQEATDAGFSMLLCATRRESAQRSGRTSTEPCRWSRDSCSASSRMSDATIRTIAGRTPLVVLNRAVPAVPSVVTDNARGIRRAVEHLGQLGHEVITYVGGPAASWADGVRWRAVQEGAHELELRARRIGPYSRRCSAASPRSRSWRPPRPRP